MSTILDFRADAYQTQCTATVTAIGPEGLRLDRTVFYALSGGQAGDKGTLTTSDGRVVDVTDTRKGATPDDIVHVVAVDAGLNVGDTVTAQIDWARRYTLMKLHTALHLLSVVLPYPVTGGAIDVDKARLDFALDDAAPALDVVSQRVNELITADHAVEHYWITDEELMAKPELVKTMSVQPPMGFGKVRLINIPGVDLQPCGGTHVKRTGEIGPITVLKLENKGKQNKRVSIALAG